MGDTGALTLGLVICFLIVSICYCSGRNGAQTLGKYIAIVLSSLLIPILEVPRLFFTRIIEKTIILDKCPFVIRQNCSNTFNAEELVGFDIKNCKQRIKDTYIPAASKMPLQNRYCAILQEQGFRIQILSTEHLLCVP